MNHVRICVRKWTRCSFSDTLKIIKVLIFKQIIFWHSYCSLESIYIIYNMNKTNNNKNKEK